LIDDERAPNGIRRYTYRDGGLAASGPGSSEEEASSLKKEKKKILEGKKTWNRKRVCCLCLRIII
jgi:hypothetical protein